MVEGWSARKDLYSQLNFMNYFRARSIFFPSGLKICTPAHFSSARHFLITISRPFRDEPCSRSFGIFVTMPRAISGDPQASLPVMLCTGGEPRNAQHRKDSQHRRQRRIMPAGQAHLTVPVSPYTTRHTWPEARGGSTPWRRAVLRRSLPPWAPRRRWTREGSSRGLPRLP
jgi:hypothetical protein